MVDYLTWVEEVVGSTPAILTKNIKMKQFNYKIKVRCWKDEITGSWLIYSRKFDISAYGETKKKARSMFDLILTEIIKGTMPKQTHW